MNVTETNIEGLLIIEPRIFADDRGYFFECYQEKKYFQNGVPYKFVQDNRSSSKKDVLRGLHFQKTKPQGKLVSVNKGEVLDVALDLRLDSATFGQHESVILSADNHRQFFIPPGFAHGFLVLSERAEFFYKCTDYYDPSDEAGLLWNDRDLNIDWGNESPILSRKDSALPTFSEFLERNEFKEG